MASIHKRTWLIRKDQKKRTVVCCVVVRGTLFPGIAARPAVSGLFLATVTPISVVASVSAWTDYALLFILLLFHLSPKGLTP